MTSVTALAARFLILLIALLPLGGSVQAQLPVPGRNAISVQLVAETDTPAAGETVTLALAMKPDPGWHGYWQNPGDAGVAPRIDWRLPAGVEAGPIQYPVPGRLMIAGLMNYVYEGSYAPLVPVRIGAGVAAGTRLKLRGTFHYLACTDTICVPETAQIAKDLVVGAVPAPAPRRALFDTYREALPKPLGSVARLEAREGRLRLAIPLPASLPMSDPYVFPLTEKAVEYSAPQSISRNGDWLIVETRAAGNAGSLAGFEGVLSIGQGNGLAFTARPAPVPAAGAAISGERGQAGGPTLILALAGAILGGLLLNIMPCVFPILSLKALSLARVGADEAAARREALAYAAGVVLVCTALGAVILALRSGGTSVGWAFQLQDPRVILFLLLVVTAIALNLAGLFALPAIGAGDRLARQDGVAGAFWTGALAAFVATPCTGPFMGAALGAALVLPAAAALAVFAGLGLGLALPFLLLGFVPQLRRLLPKPGPWMGRFQRILSLPMFATALALVWILERQAGLEGMTIGLAAALILAFSLWRLGKGRKWPPAVLGGAAALAALLLVPTDMATVTGSAQALSAKPFSEQSLETLRARGRPVFVYFTADWCITCKINEKAVLARDEVRRDFARRDIEVLVGDWTRGDAAIGRFLEQHGRSGVPLYLYYAPGKPAEILPQILTVGRLKNMGS